MYLAEHDALYAAFDRFPSPKGAATHIQHMLEVLFGVFPSTLVCVLGDELLPRYQAEDQIEIVRFWEPELDLFDRISAWSAHIHALVSQQSSLQLAHFRDPWSGVPILQAAPKQTKTIYEINGLPSIELPLHYPQLDAATLDWIRQREQACWTAADVIISPSQTMRECLIVLGVPADKIIVVPNGATVYPPSERPAQAPQQYAIYFGALQAWQGLDGLMKAWASLRDWPELELVICSATSEKRAQAFMRLAERLGCNHRIRWLFQLEKPELQSWLQHALFSVAPLTQSTRNIDQGCCPLKILESMAAGTPVIAANLPVTRELITHAQDGWLVRPDRPEQLAHAMRLLLEYPEQRQQLGKAAQRTIEQRWTWQQSADELHSLYANLVPKRNIT